MKMKLLTAFQTGKLTMVSFVGRPAFVLLTTATFARTTQGLGLLMTQSVTHLFRRSPMSLGC